jgi:hypothetical protein
MGRAPRQTHPPERSVTVLRMLEATYVDQDQWTDKETAARHRGVFAFGRGC